MFNLDTYDIGEQFYSPSFGYPPQRIGSYDVEIQERMTLNGLAESKTAAPQMDWEEGSQYLAGVIGSAGEPVQSKKNRRYGRAYVDGLGFWRSSDSSAQQGWFARLFSGWFSRRPAMPVRRPQVRQAPRRAQTRARTFRRPPIYGGVQAREQLKAAGAWW